MGPNPALERMIAGERLQELFEVLTPKQQSVVALRFLGMNQSEIADAFGVKQQNVSARLVEARRRLLREFPELAPMVTGRRRGWTQRKKGGQYGDFDASI